MKKDLVVTGIGTRKVPRAKDGAVDTRLLRLIQEIGRASGPGNWTLRSGGADGMDTLFEVHWAGPTEIYIPWPGFRNRFDGCSGAIVPVASERQALAIAETIHPNWKACSPTAKKLHARNINQVLGELLIMQSDACIYYADIDPFTSEPLGGTRTAVMLCRSLNIPTFNLKST